MPSLGEGDLGDFVDPTVKYVPLEPLANNMNEIEPERLRQYLDPEFLDATPDSRTIDSGQLEIEENERMDYDFDLDAELEEELKEDDLKAAMMAPREYQFELFQKALEGNAIAVLDTGAGKTLISVMLIKHMVLQEKQERLTRRQVVFEMNSTNRNIYSLGGSRIIGKARIFSSGSSATCISTSKCD